MILVEGLLSGYTHSASLPMTSRCSKSFSVREKEEGGGSTIWTLWSLPCVCFCYMSLRRSHSLCTSDPNERTSRSYCQVLKERNSSLIDLIDRKEKQKEQISIECHIVLMYPTLTSLFTLNQRWACDNSNHPVGD
jgi:hypothetical protein